MEKILDTAKINDRLRKQMSFGKINIELSDSVSTSSLRAKIIEAVRNYDIFDPELDTRGDHSIGVVRVSGDIYVFRFSYGDERYDYSQEVGKRTLTIQHISEFRSLKFGNKIQMAAKRKLIQPDL